MSMTIEHQVVTDVDGNPTAALIPWDQFRVLQLEMEHDDDAPLSPEWKAEIERRSRELEDGSVEGITHEEMMQRVRGNLEKR